MEVVLKIIFLAFSNTDFQFDSKRLIWKSYTIAEALSITGKIKIIDKKNLLK